jgi:hypothetical protein
MQETNLGNLTADANLAIAQAADSTVTVSIKNGGGIRTSIGETVVPPGGSGFMRQPNGELRDGSGTLIKPEGGISQTDIETTLAYNNNLSLLTLTRSELVAVLEHGLSALPGVAGQFPQLSGVQFSFDESRPAGDRIVNAAITDADGTEQDALAEYLAANFGDIASAFSQSDTGRVLDDRIQNLAVREETVIDAPAVNVIVGDSGRDRLVGTDGADILISGAGRYETMAGGLGADVFVFGDEALNGARERDIITDFEVGVDAIGLLAGVTMAEIREAGSSVIVYLDDPTGQNDAIFIRGAGVTANTIDILNDYMLAGA